MAASTTQASRTHVTKINGLDIAYRELGEGPAAVLLLHGWPTSSFLWRNVMPPIAQQNRVVAIDLPGFGASAKPLDVRYGFDFYTEILSGFLSELEINRVGLVGHDLGGPIGVHWALRNPERVSGLGLTNTLLYPEFSPAVQEFVIACSTPGLRERLTSPVGLGEIMRLGLATETGLTDESLNAVVAPFASADSRRALANAGIGLEYEGFQRIARELSTLRVPIRIVYGSEDRILPDVDETMARAAADLPQAETTVLRDCGHFLQEDAPEELGSLLAEFFAAPA